VNAYSVLDIHFIISIVLRIQLDFSKHANSARSALIGWSTRWQYWPGLLFHWHEITSRQNNIITLEAIVLTRVCVGGRDTRN